MDIKLIRDPRTGKSKGVAYVEFESQESVLLAVALSGQSISGKYYLGVLNIKNDIILDLFRFQYLAI
jgi:RNA recognition motif-containing protein